VNRISSKAIHELNGFCSLDVSGSIFAPTGTVTAADNMIGPTVRMA
jgi:hypothetical protein